MLARNAGVGDGPELHAAGEGEAAASTRAEVADASESDHDAYVVKLLAARHAACVEAVAELVQADQERVRMVAEGAANPEAPVEPWSA
jgi:hypothetical protein